MKSHSATDQYFMAILIIAYAVIVSSYWFLSFLEPIFLTHLGREDDWIETMGAVFFLIASIIFLKNYMMSGRQDNLFFGYRLTRNVYFLLLSLLFLVCFGEEISWGQRIFGWETPQVWREVNAQEETNFHNLWLFQSVNPDGSPKTFFQLFLNGNRLLSLLWLTYCLFVPIINALSVHLKRIFAFSGLPIPSLLIGGLFLGNYISFKSSLFVLNLSAGEEHSLNELKETNYGAAFAVLALFFFFRQKLVQSNTKVRTC